MSGQLDEISHAIGKLEAAVQSLKEIQAHSVELFDQHCRDDEVRHRENITTLDRNTAALDTVRKEIRNGHNTPSTILSGRQRAALVIFAVAFLGALGWIAEILFGSAVTWLISHFKFGG